MTDIHTFITRGEEPICDFCSSTPVVRSFGARATFEMGRKDIGRAEVVGNSYGDWAACEPCAQLIDRTDRDGLAKRSAERFNANMPTVVKQTLVGMEDEFRNIHDNFWKNRLPERDREVG